jgi:hypothetical protein
MRQIKIMIIRLFNLKLALNCVLSLKLTNKIIH